MDDSNSDKSPATKWLNSKQAGEYLGLSDWTVRDYAKRKLIEHTRLPGGDYRFTTEQLDAFMEARKTPEKNALVIPEKPRLQPPSNSRLSQALKKIRDKRHKEEAKKNEGKR